ncbi:hypothetical protein NliqN6_3248 [Naganishia liquefaciens]|uniref:Uncharacterized protein n=1 Tax=Naganishia liquefaciens TaxID=104408 RepID=A0A8H3YGN2_9TREE|nr:hypothetical protein NliqN6_3248 [Naganishia liquefaciens]
MSSAASSAAASASSNVFGPLTTSTATSFYRNLFYILVAVLIVFLVVTLFSYIRTRRRRQIIEAEARRLGLLVPGMPGYLTERARLAGALRGEKKSSKVTPLIWDIASKESAQAGGKPGDEKLGLAAVDYGNMSALALAPMLEVPALGPIPMSTIKYFPNSMAFRAPLPEASAETIIKQWETELEGTTPPATGTGEDELKEGRRGRARGKSLVDMYPQAHVPPLRHSIERPRRRKDSRAAELADQLGNKLFGPPRLPAIASTADVSGMADLEAQTESTQFRADEGVEMTQIRGAGEPDIGPTSLAANEDDARRPSVPHNGVASKASPTVQLVAFVRMPIPEQSRELVGRGTWHSASEEEQEKAVQAEWAGIELGITEMEIVGEASPGASNGVWRGSL